MLQLPSDVALIRSKVKRLRIEVKRGGKVSIIAPLIYPESSISDFFYAKQKWIEKTKSKFAQEEILRSQSEKISKILLLGQEYEFILDLDAPQPTIEHVSRSVKYKHDLLLNSQMRESWLRRLAETILIEFVNRIAAAHGFVFGKVKARSQRTKWGSCSPTGNLSFNWRLVMAPPRVIEYLVCHELAHTVQHNHSAKFWKLVSDICPDYASAEKWLRDNGNRLMRY